MEKLELDECKKIELQILKSVKQFCMAKHIRYYLCGGTLIGAIRHKGFIPWDDDIDIMMPRKDYKRFIQLFPEEGINGFRLLSPYTEEDCCIVYSKVYDPQTLKQDKEFDKKYWKYGVDIDIFPTDGLPKSESECNKYFKTQYRDFHLFLALVGGYDFNGGVFKQLVKIIFTSVIKFAGKLNILSAKKLCERINARAEKYVLEDSEQIAVSIFPHYGKREIVDKMGFLKQIEVEFEEDIFTAPSSYHEYLVSLYGNYMKLPPVNQRCSHHRSDVYKKVPNGAEADSRV